MSPIVQTRSDTRNAILGKINTYERLHDGTTVSLNALQPFLASIKSYLEDEATEDGHYASVKSYIDLGDNGDEFGDIEDEDLMLAEIADSALTDSSSKRTAPPDFEDESETKRLKGIDGSPVVLLAESILRHTWGFTQFRLKQQHAISRLITGGSAVVVFPTGGGKSLVYQIPALAFNDYDQQCGRSSGGGITLVVSPLIALMKVSDSIFTRKIVIGKRLPSFPGSMLMGCVGSS